MGRPSMVSPYRIGRGVAIDGEYDRLSDGRFYYRGPGHSRMAFKVGDLVVAHISAECICRYCGRPMHINLDGVDGYITPRIARFSRY